MKQLIWTIALAIITFPTEILAEQKIDPEQIFEAFSKHCLDPMIAGELPDLTRLSFETDGPPLGTPDAEIKILNIVDGITLNVNTESWGDTKCEFSGDSNNDAIYDKIEQLLATRMEERGFEALPICDIGNSIRFFGHYEGRMVGLRKEYLRVVLYRISLGPDHPDVDNSIHLMSAESKTPFTREERCDES